MHHPLLFSIRRAKCCVCFFSPGSKVTRSLCRSHDRAIDGFTLGVDDGILIALMKILFSLEFLWHFTIFHYLVMLIGSFVTPVADKVMSSEKNRKCTGDEICRWAIDAYMCLMTVILVVCYYHTLEYHGTHPLLIKGCVLFACHRIFELLTVMVGLHANPVYVTRNPVRALVNTIWHYGEVTVAFAVFYVALSPPTDYFSFDKVDEFGKWETALYFSFVTITTLGYGDISPIRGCVQLLISLEVLLGFVFLIIAIQRILATPTSGEKERKVRVDTKAFNNELPDAGDEVGTLKQSTDVVVVSDLGDAALVRTSLGEVFVESNALS